MILATTNNNAINVCLLYDVATKALWDADSTYNKWVYYGIDNRVTITPRSISGNYSSSVSLSNMSIIPITNKPTGYFT